LLAIVTSWWHILLIRFTDRMAKGMRGAPRDVMVAESVGKERLGSAYGLIQSMDSAGAIAGPLAALLLMSRFGIRGVFWAAAVPGALSVLVAIFGIRETKPSSSPEQEPTATQHTRISAGIRPGRTEAAVSRQTGLPAAFYIVLAAVTLFSLGNSSDMFLVMRAQSIGIAAKLAPLLGLVFNITYTLGSWPAGRLSDHFSRRWIAAVGYLISLAFTLCLDMRRRYRRSG
jgi:MFS family permease